MKIRPISALVFLVLFFTTSLMAAGGSFGGSTGGKTLDDKVKKRFGIPNVVPATKSDFQVLRDALDKETSVYSLDIRQEVTPILDLDTTVQAVTKNGEFVFFVEIAE